MYSVNWNNITLAAYCTRWIEIGNFTFCWFLLDRDHSRFTGRQLPLVKLTHEHPRVTLLLALGMITKQFYIFLKINIAVYLSFCPKRSKHDNFCQKNIILKKMCRFWWNTNRWRTHTKKVIFYFFENTPVIIKKNMKYFLKSVVIFIILWTRASR